MQGGTPPELAPAALIDGDDPAVGAATSDSVVSDVSAPPGGAPGAVMQDARMKRSMTTMCMGDASTANRCRQSSNAVASQILSGISLCYQCAFCGSCSHVTHIQNPLPHIIPAKWNLMLLQRIPLHRPQLSQMWPRNSSKAGR